MGQRKRGGQWAEMDPELSEPMQKIVRILRALVDDSGLRLKGVQQLLLVKHQDGPRPPSYDRLSQRLRGKGLQNNAWLINLLLEELTPPDRRDALAAEVGQHLLDARTARATSATQAQRRPTQEPVTPELLDVLRENRNLRKEAEKLNRLLDRKDKNLQTLRDQLAAVERRIPFARTAADPPQDVRPTSRPASTEGASAPEHSARPTGEARDGALPADPAAPDSGLMEVARTLRNRGDFEAVTADALRWAFDAVLDGVRTGRFDVKALDPSERAYIATKIIHEVTRVWSLQPGSSVNFLIGQQEVLLKVTLGRTWTFSPEDIGHLCLLLSADDQRSIWSLGLIRVGPEHLHRAPGNRDRKRQLSAAGRKAAVWLFKDAPLPVNTLLHLSPSVREQILAPEAGRGVVTRLENLFKLAQGQVVNHTAIRTVAMREDPLRRFRSVRDGLRREGILVFGHQDPDREIARKLGLPELRAGEWVSQRVVRLRPVHGRSTSVTLSGEAWTKAGPDDPVEELR